MKRHLLLPGPLVAALERADKALPAAGLARRIAKVQAAVDAFEQRYEQILSSRERALRQLRAENRQLRRQLQETRLERTILQDVNRRLQLRSLQQRQVLEYLGRRYGLDARQARHLLGITRKLLPPNIDRKAGKQWQLSLQERTRIWMSMGVEQVNLVIQKQGWTVGRRLAYRVYVEEPRRQLKKQARKAVTTPAAWLKRLRPDF